MASRADGTTASRTTALAPGSATSAGIAADPPPAVISTTRRPRACNVASSDSALKGWELDGAMSSKDGAALTTAGVGKASGAGEEKQGLSGAESAFVDADSAP